jgi:pseudouridine-5'-phosphate glycosidase/pseudouridine kinase
VSGTLSIAHKVGIPLFVTGGMGGVHRDGHISFDISADLAELGRTPMGVVSAGIKSILDIPRTLEILEALGVTVVTYGDSNQFPAFFTPESESYVDYNIDTPLGCAQLLNIIRKYDSMSGLLIAVPPPLSADNTDGHQIEQAIQQALVEADDNGITGKAVTPFLLDRVNQLTDGKSLTANINLIKNNAIVGSKIAVELSNLQNRSSNERSHDHIFRATTPIKPATPVNPLPVVIGASAVDVIAKVKENPLKREGTNTGTLKMSFGGVARNIAECMVRINCQPLLISCVGGDRYGNMLLNHMNSLDMCKDGMQILPGERSAVYCAVLEHDGEVHCGVGDMNINDKLTAEWVQQFSLETSPFICIDGNISLELIEYACHFASQYNIPIWFEPTCVYKSVKPIQSNVIDKITYTSPNLIELHNMSSLLVGSLKAEPLKHVSLVKDKIDYAVMLSAPLLDCVPHVFVTLGIDGVLYINREEVWHYTSGPTHLLPIHIGSVSGAGDCFVGGVVGSLVNGKEMNIAIKVGLKAAYDSVTSSDTVSPSINNKLPKEWNDINPIRIMKS